MRKFRKVNIEQKPLLVCECEELGEASGIDCSCSSYIVTKKGGPKVLKSEGKFDRIILGEKGEPILTRRI